MTTACNVPVIAFKLPQGCFLVRKDHPVVAKAKDRSRSADAGARAFEHELIGFPGEDVFPGERFVSDLQRHVVSVLPQSEWLFSLKAMPLASKGKFPEFHDEPEQSIAKGGRCKREAKGPKPRGRLHHLRKENAKEKSCRSAAPGDFIGDDEMLDVDERGSDQQCEKNPIDRCEWKTVAGPCKDKERRGEKLNQKVPKGNPRPACLNISRAIRPS